MKTNSSPYWNKIGKSYASEWEHGGRKYVSQQEENFLNYSINSYLPGNHQKIMTLDLGMGAGRILSILEKNKIINNITGVDLSEEMLDYCKEKFKRSKKITGLTQADISKKLPFSNGSFNLVTSIRAIKYNKNWKDILKEVNRILKKNGIFIFEMPNANSINRLSKIEVSIYKTTLQELKQALQENDFEILKVKGGPVLPGLLYDKIQGRLLNLAMLNEKFLKMVLGETFLSRFIYIACRKI